MSFVNKPSKNRFIVSIILALALMLISSSSVQAQYTYDWVIIIETQELKRLFEYKGAKLKPVIRAKVSYHKVRQPEQITDYQNMWFYRGKSIGLDRLHKFEVAPGAGVAIKVLHQESQTTNAERKAAAGAILRLYLDSYLNRNSVVMVTVPTQSFEDISRELQDHKFRTQLSAGAGVSMVLRLQDRNNKKSKTLYR